MAGGQEQVQAQGCVRPALEHGGCPSPPTCCWAGWCPPSAPSEWWGLPLQVWIVLASYPLPRTALYLSLIHI
eukprot:10631759-Prorocentrum_lima.AAC.1